MRGKTLLAALLLPLSFTATASLPPLVAHVGQKAVVKVCDVTFERHILGRPETREKVETRHQSMRVYDFTDHVWFEDGTVSVVSGELRPQTEAVSIYRSPTDELMVRGRNGASYVYSQAATNSVRLLIDNCTIERKPQAKRKA